jgi:hypothetical protein
MRTDSCARVVRFLQRAAIVSIACASIGPGRPAAAQSRADYLPLAVGSRWELKPSSGSAAPLVFEVADQSAGSFAVRWQNPWVPDLQFRFVKGDGDVRLAGLDTGRGAGPLPAGMVYFDFKRPKGTTWRNAVGTYAITNTGERITTPLGSYDACIEIQTTDNNGQSMFWSFAPNVGFVRFGRGRDSYLLSSFTPGSPRSTALPPPLPSPGTSGGDAPLIGLAENPPGDLLTDRRAQRDAFKLAVESGITFHYLSPKWNEMEPSADRYDFSDVDRQVALAADAQLPLALNVRIVDTNNRSMPKAYEGWSFSDPRTADKLKGLLRTLGPRVRGRVRWIAIGNEVDAYFGSHTKEIDDYALLMQRVLDTVHEAFPRALFSVNFQFISAGDIRSRYRALAGLLDYYSFTYYPLNADFSMRSPDVAAEDIDRMTQVAGERKVFIQEVGYATAERLHSSEDKQSQFVQNVMNAIDHRRARIMAANFLFMSDFPDGLVNDFAKYYRLPNSDNFKAYLATLGLRDKQGKPKRAWSVFEREARRLAAAR